MNKDNNQVEMIHAGVQELTDDQLAEVTGGYKWLVFWKMTVKLINWFKKKKDEK